MDVQYTVLPQSIGKGSFGQVHIGIHKVTGKLYAVKVEEKKAKQHLLKTENIIIRYATASSSMTSASASTSAWPPGIIKSYFFWEDRVNYYMVTDLLGPTIGKLHTICGQSFGLKTTLMLAEQMISILKYYHQHNIIHRDIKPDNFLIEYGLPHKQIYLIDFGLSKKFRINGHHIPYKTGVARMGSVRYMSVNCHRSEELSRRDDMYSLGYVLIYLFHGELPWQTSAIREAKEDRYEYVYNFKKNTNNDKLTEELVCFDCKKQGKPCGFRRIMKAYFDYLDTLGFADDINYNYILKELLLCMEDHDMKYDYNWDWIKFYGTP